MKKEQLYVAEVGHSVGQTSATGIPTSTSEPDYLDDYPILIPRLTIFEPGITGGYRENNYQYEDWQELKADRLPIKLVEQDIYDPEINPEIPQIALIIFENVINDLSYLYPKNYENLFALLQQTVTPHELILFIESLLPNSRLDEKYRKFRTRLTQSGLTIVEDNFHSAHTHDPEKRKAVIRGIIEQMKMLESHDTALEQGLNKYHDEKNRLLLLEHP